MTRFGNSTDWLRAPQYNDLVQVVNNSRFLDFMEGTLAASLALGTCIACIACCVAGAATCVRKFHLSARLVVFLTVLAISCFALIDAGAESLLMDTNVLSVTLTEQGGS